MKKNLILSVLVLSNVASMNAVPKSWLSWFTAESAPAKKSEPTKNNQALGEECAQSMLHRHAGIVKKVELPESVVTRLKEVDVKTWRDESGLSLLDIAVTNGYTANEEIVKAGGQLTENGLAMLVGQMTAKAHFNCLSEAERHDYEKTINQYAQAGVKMAEENRLVWRVNISLEQATTQCEAEKKGKFERAGGGCRNKKVFEYLLATAVANKK